MLTAIRAMAHRVAQDLAHMDTPRLGPDATDEEQDELLAEVLENALEAAKEAVERGPEQLAVLREAGVVDAGAYGLTVIIAGCVAALRGKERPELDAPGRGRCTCPEHESSSYRYCTNFAVTGQELEAGSFVPRLEELGDSVLVVGDDRRRFACTSTPTIPKRRWPCSRRSATSRVSTSPTCTSRWPTAAGRLGGRGRAEPPSRPAAWSRWRAAAACAGSTRSSARYVVDGGLDDEPVHLRAARRHPRRARGRGRRAAQQPQRDPRRRAGGRAVGAAGARGRHDRPAGGARRAPRLRPRRDGRGQRGGGRGRRRPPCASAAWRPPPATTPRAASAPATRWATPTASSWPGGAPRRRSPPRSRASAKGAELLTCIAGAGAPLPLEAVERAAPDGVELEYHEGGQPAWWWLFAAE